MAAAQDETYRDAKNLHSKYLRHQAFEREIAANKDRLMHLQEVSGNSLFLVNFISGLFRGMNIEIVFVCEWMWTLAVGSNIFNPSCLWQQ